MYMDIHGKSVDMDTDMDVKFHRSCQVRPTEVHVA